jgi:AraC family transcriptional regulator
MDSSVHSTFFGTALANCASSHFSLILAQFEPNEDLARHFHDTAFISVVLGGGYREKCGSSICECGIGQAIFHAPGEFHSNRFFEEGGQVLSLGIASDFLFQLKDVGIEAQERTVFGSSHSLQLAAKLRTEMTRAQDPASQLAIEGLSLELMAEMMRHRTAGNVRCKGGWIERVREMVNDRYREPLSLAELAAAASVHPVHLARAFRSRYNCCIGDYVRSLRVAAASHELVCSDLPIVEIAARNGFADQSHLSRTLKQRTGFSPRQYRRLRSRKCPL